MEGAVFGPDIDIYAGGREGFGTSGARILSDQVTLSMVEQRRSGSKLRQ
jgi:hypothetical protein